MFHKPLVWSWTATRTISKKASTSDLFSLTSTNTKRTNNNYMMNDTNTTIIVVSISINTFNINVKNIITITINSNISIYINNYFSINMNNNMTNNMNNTNLISTLPKINYFSPLTFQFMKLKRSFSGRTTATLIKNTQKSWDFEHSISSKKFLVVMNRINPFVWFLGGETWNRDLIFFEW